MKRAVVAALGVLLGLATPVWSQATDTSADPIEWLARNLGGAACVVYDAGPSPTRLEHVIENTEVQFDGCRMVLEQASTAGSYSEVRRFELPLGALDEQSVTSHEGFFLPESWMTRGDVPTHTITIKVPAGESPIGLRIERFDGTPVQEDRADVVSILVRHQENATRIVRELSRAIERCRR